MEPTWICLWLPQLALDGVLRRQSVNGPLVLVDGPLHSRRLIAVNAMAAQAGLQAGQSLSTAHALLASFEMVAYEPAEELQWQTFLAGVAYRYSSEVHLLPQALVLEVSRSISLFGDGPTIAGLLREAFEQLGFQHRIAMAPTPHAAYVLAGIRDGIMVDSLTQLDRVLDRVPVDRVELPGRAVERLPGMGIRFLGQLRRLPQDAVRRRFGHELVQALQVLTGERPAELPLYRPPDALDWRFELSHEVESVAALVFPLRRMMGDLATLLRGRDGGVQRFCLQLEHRQGHTAVPVGLLAPAREMELLFEAMRGRLEQVRLLQPVLALRLVADHLPGFIPEGRDLFDDRCAQVVPFEQLRERLRARLGDEAIKQWRTTRDPRPEHSQALGPADEGWLEPLPRPTWLLPYPRPWRGTPPRILAGPERLETGWWDGAAVQRDYYLVESGQGQRAWAFCPPGETTGWMLHGWFA
ncbi:Y-family DNA polymerase [Frateuria aurantia]